MRKQAVLKQLWLQNLYKKEVKWNDREHDFLKIFDKKKSEVGKVDSRNRLNCLNVWTKII